MLSALVLLIELMTLCVSIVCLRKSDGWWLWFIPFLSLTVLVELLGFMKTANHWIYNIYFLSDILFTSFIFVKIWKQLAERSWMIKLVAVLIVWAYFSELFERKLKVFYIHSYTFFSIAIVLFCFVYYYRLLRNTEYIELGIFPAFWIITGLFLFYFCSTASNFTFDILLSIRTSSNKPVRQWILLVLNIILYSCWSYAFICRYRQKILS